MYAGPAGPARSRQRPPASPRGAVQAYLLKAGRTGPFMRFLLIPFHSLSLLNVFFSLLNNFKSQGNHLAFTRHLTGYLSSAKLRSQSQSIPVNPWRDSFHSQDSDSALQLDFSRVFESLARFLLYDRSTQQIRDAEINLTISEERLVLHKAQFPRWKEREGTSLHYYLM
jgi:hypothetical protein